MSQLNDIPLSYTTPPFPSLYWPFNTLPTEPKYLYTLTDIWKFTLYWTLITIPLAHILVALWAILMQFLSAGDRSRTLRQTYANKSSTNMGRRKRGAGEKQKTKAKKKKKSTKTEDRSTTKNPTTGKKKTTSISGLGSNESRIKKGRRRNINTNDEENYYTADSASEDNTNDNMQSTTNANQESNTDTDTDSSSASSSSSSSSSTTPRQARSKVVAQNRKLLGGSPFKSTIKWSGVILAVYMILGATEAFIAGSLVGVVLGAVYNAGNFRMSVWTPLFWGIINMLVLILASFRISGGM